MDPLTTLDLVFGPKTSTDTCHQLLQLLPQTKVENLYVTLRQPTKDLPILFDAVSKTSTLKSLTLQSTEAWRVLTLEDMELTRCTNLRALNMGGHGFTLGGFASLIKCLDSLPLQTLTLEQCGLRAEYVRNLTFRNTALTSLSLAKNAPFGHEGLKLLAESLRGSKITELNLSRSCMGNLGLKAILDVLPDTSLAHLDIRSTFHFPCGDPMDGIDLITRELPSLGLTTLDFRGHTLSAWKIRCLAEAVKRANSPVTNVLVDTVRAPAAGLVLEQALQAKNATSLVLQLRIVELGDNPVLEARKMSGDVVGMVPCGSQDPVGRCIPILLRESMRALKTLPEGSFNLKLVLPNGQLLRENTEPVMSQCRAMTSEAAIPEVPAPYIDSPPVKKPRRQ